MTAESSNAADELERERSARVRAEERVREIESSLSYRMGHALVLALKRPATLVIRLVRRLFRMVYGRMSPETRRRVLGWGEDHLPARVMGRLRAANRAMRSGGVGLGARDTGPGPRRSLLSEDLPVYGYVLLGLEEASLAGHVRTIVSESVMQGDHVPLVITDSLAFGLLRSLGAVFEYVPSRESWERAGVSRIGWEEMVRDRLAHLRSVHDLRRVTIVTGGEPPVGRPPLV